MIKFNWKGNKDMEMNTVRQKRRDKSSLHNKSIEKERDGKGEQPAQLLDGKEGVLVHVPKERIWV